MFGPLQDHLAVPAALAGLIPAAVYADAPGHHGIALLHARHRLYLAGAPGSAPPLQQIHTLFQDTLRPQAQAAGQEMFTLWLAPADWAEPVREALADRRCARWPAALAGVGVRLDRGRRAAALSQRPLAGLVPGIPAIAARSTGADSHARSRNHHHDRRR